MKKQENATNILICDFTYKNIFKKSINFHIYISLSVTGHHNWFFYWLKVYRLDIYVCIKDYIKMLMEKRNCLKYIHVEYFEKLYLMNQVQFPVPFGIQEYLRKLI